MKTAKEVYQETHRAKEMAEACAKILAMYIRHLNVYAEQDWLPIDSGLCMIGTERAVFTILGIPQPLHDLLTLQFEQETEHVSNAMQALDVAKKFVWAAIAAADETNVIVGPWEH